MREWRPPRVCTRFSSRFLENAALQCGICTPGFIVASKALLEAEPDADEARVRHWLAGNLCRCNRLRQDSPRRAGCGREDAGGIDPGYAALRRQITAEGGQLTEVGCPYVIGAPLTVARLWGFSVSGGG